MFDAICHELNKGIELAEHYHNKNVGFVLNLDQAKKLNEYLKTCQMLTCEMRFPFGDVVHMPTGCMVRVAKDEVVSKITREIVSKEDTVHWHTSLDPEFLTQKVRATVIVGNPCLIADEWLNK